MYTIKVSKFRHFNWHHLLSIDLLEHGRYWMAGITMFYDPQLSAEVLKDYLPLDVIERMFTALESTAAADEVELEVEALPSWPWKPDAKALNEACIHTGTRDEPGVFLAFIEDGFRLKIKLEGQIKDYFPPELAGMADKLWDKFRSNTLVFHGVTKEEPRYI